MTDNGRSWPIYILLLFILSSFIFLSNKFYDFLAVDSISLDKNQHISPNSLPKNYIDDKHDNDISFVYLQKFPLQGVPFFHTEILVCSRNLFSKRDQIMLEEQITKIEKEDKVNYVLIDKSWWSQINISCTQLGYGGNNCKDRCCTVPHGIKQINYPLNASRAIISNADTTKKSVYLYGKGRLNGEGAYQGVCGGDKCWSNWAGKDYNIITNNCNTFTSTVLSCVFGLSQKKPHLGVSDLVTVNCNCSQQTMLSLDEEMENKYAEVS